MKLCGIIKCLDAIIGLGEEPCYANNHELLKERCTSIYLRASIDTLFNRLLIKAKDPTCKKSDAEMKEFIAVHL
jgi:shikimate kinase